MTISIPSKKLQQMNKFRIATETHIHTHTNRPKEKTQGEQRKRVSLAVGHYISKQIPSHIRFPDLTIMKTWQ